MSFGIYPLTESPVLAEDCLSLLFGGGPYRAQLGRWKIISERLLSTKETLKTAA